MGQGGSRYRRQRNTFRRREAPGRQRAKPFPELDPPGEPADDLRPFAEWFIAQEEARDRFRWVLRDSLDELLDGQRTGRWCYQHLSKTEKIHLGTIVEINLTKEFEIPDGADLDWRVGDEDLDCKFSREYGGWAIPLEMYVCGAEEGSGLADRAALLLWMNDDTSQWAAGLFRANDYRLGWKKKKKPGEPDERAFNRDKKRTLSDEGLVSVHWLWGGLQSDLPVNTILHMGDNTRSRVFAATSGQQRINELFRCCPNQLISRATILTVAQQDDAMKRARDARQPGQLGNEGFMVLGHQDASPHIAERLGLPIPEKGEFVSCRVTEVERIDSRPRFHADGRCWALATDDDQPDPAPQLPKSKKAAGGDWVAYLNACS